MRVRRDLLLSEFLRREIRLGVAGQHAVGPGEASAVGGKKGTSYGNNSELLCNGAAAAYGAHALAFRGRNFRLTLK